MSPNDAYDPIALDALINGLDGLGAESSALLIAARPAIRRAIARGATSTAIRHEIFRVSGIKLSPEQFRRLLDAPDNGGETVPTQGVLAKAFSAHVDSSTSTSIRPPTRRHIPIPSHGR